MNASTTNKSKNSVSSPTEDAELARVLDLDRLDGRNQDRGSQKRPANRVLQFIAELRRRQVCRTITMYTIAFWVVCQVVDVVSPHLELPIWTLKLVIVLGLIGLPIAVILSWLFDITRDGVLVDNAGVNCSRSGVADSRGRFNQFLDCGLLLVALVIGVQLSTGVFSDDAYTATPTARKVAVLPLRVSATENAEFLSQQLTSELQHEIASTTRLTVIAPREHFLDASCVTLSGAIAASASIVRVTATLIDNKTGEITWSQVFEIPNTDSINVPTAIAKEIVAALPLSLLEIGGEGRVNAT